jgi:hypothetical protein
LETLYSYGNGNYSVEIFSDGTKVRKTEEENFISDFPENIDIKITDWCDAGCNFCHENSTKAGKHGDILNLPFMKSLHMGTEMAIGGGNPLAHPDLVPFLETLERNGIIANLTVHWSHFQKERERLLSLTNRRLVKGIGVSVSKKIDTDIFNDFPNIVLHTINGITDMETYKHYSGKNLKVLILGYKNWGRGVGYYSEATKTLMKKTYDNIHDIIAGYSIVSFDNLGIEQLNIRRLFTTAEWERFYMGDDGKYTMYIDAVKGEYAKNSTHPLRKKLLPTIHEMFHDVKTI